MEQKMAAERVGDMTLDELNQLIVRVVKRQLELISPAKKRTMDEVNASIRKHRITLPAGAKSSLELLREDRDS
jgi:hypothetical protein